MSGGRDAIFGAVRAGLGRGPLDDAKTAELEQGLRAPKRNLLPARIDLDQAGLRELFERMATQSSATVESVATLDEVPQRIAEFLAGRNLPTEIVATEDEVVTAIPWGQAPMLSVASGLPDGRTEVGVTSALAGVAETGTLMAVSGPDHPATLNFLPGTHIVVLPADRVVGSYEDGWDAVRALAARQGEGAGAGAMPRTVNFITGPSRTGDIEQKIQMGAHGPLNLHIILVNEFHTM